MRVDRCVVRCLDSQWFVWVSQSNHIPMDIEEDKDRPWLALQVFCIGISVIVIIPTYIKHVLSTLEAQSEVPSSSPGRVKVKWLFDQIDKFKGSI